MKQNLVTVDAATLVIDAAKLMRACNVGSVLVSKQERIVGIVTESDIVKKFLGADKVPYFIAVVLPDF